MHRLKEGKEEQETKKKKREIINWMRWKASGGTEEFEMVCSNQFKMVRVMALLLRSCGRLIKFTFPRNHFLFLSLTVPVSSEWKCLYFIILYMDAGYPMQCSMLNWQWFSKDRIRATEHIRTQPNNNNDKQHFNWKRNERKATKQKMNMYNNE